jgi:integrase
MPNTEICCPIASRNTLRSFTIGVYCPINNYLWDSNNMETTMGQVLTMPTRKAPRAKNGTVPPMRRANAEVRSREHLTEAEVSKLMKAASGDETRRYGGRDSTMILIAFRHALRVSELVNLRWSDVDFKAARLNVKRLKGSISGTHPLEGDEVRALRKLRAQEPEAEFAFTTERGGPMSAAGFRKMLARLAEGAGMSALKVHPHALRHATGYVLANKGLDTRTLQSYMGHREISNTVRYTALDANRFKGLWSR